MFISGALQLIKRKCASGTTQKQMSALRQMMSEYLKAGHAAKFFLNSASIITYYFSWN
jgi:hypothetical protein